MNDDRKKFDAAMAFLTSRVSSGRCIRDPLADLHEALVPFHGKASGDPFARMDAVYAALSEKPIESGLWRPEEGKYGRARNGEVVGPFAGRANPDFPWIDGTWGHTYRSDGRYSRHNHHPLDLVSEWIEPAEEPPLEIRKGAWYMRRDGKVVGPAEARRARVVILHPWLVDGVTYTNSGSYLRSSDEDELDLIREVPAPEASE